MRRKVPRPEGLWYICIGIEIVCFNLEFYVLCYNLVFKLLGKFLECTPLNLHPMLLSSRIHLINKLVHRKKRAFLISSEVGHSYTQVGTGFVPLSFPL